MNGLFGFLLADLLAKWIYFALFNLPFYPSSILFIILIQWCHIICRIIPFICFHHQASLCGTRKLWEKKATRNISPKNQTQHLSDSLLVRHVTFWSFLTILLHHNKLLSATAPQIRTTNHFSKSFNKIIPSIEYSKCQGRKILLTNMKFST